MKRAVIATLAALASLAAAGSAGATVYTVGFPDVVLDYYNSGVGPFPGPYGATSFNGFGPTPISTDVILGYNDVTFNGFVSLPTGSYITLGFTDEIITNGPGDDIFISEVGASGEYANIFVSSDLVNFTFLGEANNSPFQSLRRQSFDLGRIGFTDVVRAIRVVGLDNFGNSPGFDLNAVQITFTSYVEGNPNATSAAPEPGTWLSMILGFGLAGAAFRTRRRMLRV